MKHYCNYFNFLLIFIVILRIFLLKEHLKKFKIISKSVENDKMTDVLIFFGVFFLIKLFQNLIFKSFISSSLSSQLFIFIPLNLYYLLIFPCKCLFCFDVSSF